MPLAKTDKELARQLQVEEEAAEEAHQGRDVAILEVVMEAAGPLTHRQAGRFGGLHQDKCTSRGGWAELQLSAAVAVQPPVVVGQQPSSP